MTMMLYAMREREDLVDCYEAVSGSRVRGVLPSGGRVHRDLPDTMPQYKELEVEEWREAQKLNEARSGSLFDFLDDFVRRFPELGTSTRRCSPTIGSGSNDWLTSVLSPERAIQLGFTGPMLRGSGTPDLRKATL